MKIGVIGLGTVGFGVVDILSKEKDRLAKAIQEEVVLKYACGLEEIELPEGILYTKDYKEVVNDPEVDVVVELIGGTTIAKSIILESIYNKKHVVTANKALLAHDGKEIFKAAKENNVHIFYEASVGGGIPVLVSQKESFIANNTLEIAGILNGTTNFILSLMEKDNLSFEEALQIASDLGYVEANPALDLDGVDAAHKIAILAMNGFETYAPFDDIQPSGIRNVTKLDMDIAFKLGYRIKLIAQAKLVPGGIGIDVGATLVSLESLVANVMGSYNVVEINGDYVNDIVYYGRGAGRHVTASAVVSDIMKTVQERRWNHDYKEGTKVFPITLSKYYIRSSSVLPIEFLEYYSEKDNHVYIVDEIELSKLKQKLEGFEYVLFKVRG
ncbi:homoserine dehydrogenase [Tannockella kyphosi]|uniref:homoserine dehydrogenase n=1 Tax=Tannockella kyphosi TaxID=2899121 RepID=UPI0020134334|nr:homoserine dehydrogenase [Tannockella kyphosi]